MSKRRFGSLSLASFLALMLFAMTSYAQSGGTTVRGTVKDPAGNLVSGATVTLTDPSKNFTRTQQTNEDGQYVFNAVPPGTYKLDISATGFKTASASGVEALVDTPTVRDVQLEIGAVSETVDVTSAAEAAINTSDATIGNSFERKRIVELPLNANNVVGLLSLQPGVTRGGTVNGGRADQSNITLDGVDVNEQQDGLDVITDEAFASVLRVTRDSLQEFRVTTTNPNAEQGRSSGAQVSLVTRSGSNDWHGSLFEIHRNTVTTANDFFNNAAGVERPQLLRNIFGGSIGGPIKKDRAFFFFTYEGFREATATSVVREVPLPTLGQGLVRYRTESGDSDPGCPAGTPAGVNCLTPGEIEAAYIARNGNSPGINPDALAFLAAAAQRYPANDTTVGDGLNTGGFRFNARTPTELNTYIGRFDFNLTNSQTLFLRGNYQNDNVTRAVYFSSDCSVPGDNIQCFPDTPPLTTWNHPKGIAAGHVWTVNNSVVNRFNYGLTRASFTQNGDSEENRVNFRFIFSPQGFARTLRRTTPVHNFVDDVSWVRGNHTYGFGGNIRLIKNNRNSLGASFDEAIINPSFYNASGAVLIRPFSDFESSSDLRDALASVIGRYSQYSANLVYDGSGQLQTVGTETERSFATEEYEGYFQDSWRMRPNFTLNYGLRWSTSTPVYERNGLQVVPNINLTDYFNRRVESANSGVPFTDPITFILGGKANNAPGYYEQDWNNFAPSVSFAWSPDFGDNTFGKVFGREGKSVIRGGFRMTYDRIGSQLAVNFDLNNLAGFTSAKNINANTFDVRTNTLGPLFGGANPTVRTLPFPGQSPISPTLDFPLTVPADEDQRIEVSLDQGITTPYNYSFNFSYGRELGKGLSFEASYVGRFARNLLASRDIMQLNNIRDPQSGMTYREAINQLVDFRYANREITSIPDIAFFNNFFPFMPAWGEAAIGSDPTLTPTQAAYAFLAPAGVGGADIIDYTFLQLLWDDRPDCTTCPPSIGGGPGRLNNLFYQPQFGALSAFSTIARSNYNSLQLSMRQRLRDDITFDFNYTYGHSLDNASGLQSSGSYGASFIVDALFPDDNYASSDFDARHIINANWVVGLPFGRGKRFFSSASGFVEQAFGGWQTTGIFRWNSGLPITGAPFDCCVWATNWNVQSNGVRVRPIQTSTTKDGEGGTPNLFSDPLAAYRSFRPARPGEVGDRNVLRGPGYISLDMGLYKSFKMPWEGHSLQFRWEVFNVTNTQRFDAVTISDLSLGQDPFLGGNPASDFGQFTSTQTPLNETKAGRVMQFALRYTF